MLFDRAERGDRQEGQASAPAELSRSEPPVRPEREEIAHSRGLITKDEVRAVTLHALRLPDAGSSGTWAPGLGPSPSRPRASLRSIRLFRRERSGAARSYLETNRSAFAHFEHAIVSGDAPRKSLCPCPTRQGLCRRERRKPGRHHRRGAD